MLRDDQPTEQVDMQFRFRGYDDFLYTASERLHKGRVGRLRVHYGLAYFSEPCQITRIIALLKKLTPLPTEGR